MKHCPLYNGQNLNFTGNYNPYGLIQKAGKRRYKRSKKNLSKKNKRKTRKYKR